MHVRRALIVIACCVSAIACGDDSHGAQPSKVIARIELTGPSTIAPGSVGQFSLSAFYADGTSSDVTVSAAWQRSSGTVEPQGPGRYLGRNRGEVIIIARYGQFSQSKEVVIVPTGTFRVTGRVYEPGTTSPVAQARVSVNGGADGLTADTDFSGYFKFYGVPADAEFTISHDGYQTQSLRRQFSDHSAITLEIPLAGPRLQFSGTYTTTFDWRSCSSQVRPEDMHRVYTAAVTQAGQVLDVRFTDEFFAVNSAARGNLMQGQIDAAGVTLYADQGFSYYYYGPAYYPFVVERVPDDGRLLVAVGTAKLAPSGASFIGEFTGFLQIYARGNPFGTQMGSCGVARLSFTDRR